MNSNSDTNDQRREEAAKQEELFRLAEAGNAEALRDSTTTIDLGVTTQEDGRTKREKLTNKPEMAAEDGLGTAAYKALAPSKLDGAKRILGHGNSSEKRKKTIAAIGEKENGIQSLEQRNARGQAVGHLAVAKKDLGTINQLIELGANLTVRDPDAPADSKDPKHITALELAKREYEESRVRQGRPMEIHADTFSALLAKLLAYAITRQRAKAADVSQRDQIVKVLEKYEAERSEAFKQLPQELQGYIAQGREGDLHYDDAYAALCQNKNLQTLIQKSRLNPNQAKDLVEDLAQSLCAGDALGLNNGIRELKERFYAPNAEAQKDAFLAKEEIRTDIPIPKGMTSMSETPHWKQIYKAAEPLTDSELSNLTPTQRFYEDVRNNQPITKSLWDHIAEQYKLKPGLYQSHPNIRTAGMEQPGAERASNGRRG